MGLCKQNDVLRTLDMDPDVSCTGDDKTGSPFYCFRCFFCVLHGVSCIHVRKAPKGVSLAQNASMGGSQNCGAYTIHAGACNSCEDCAKRQQFHGFLGDIIRVFIFGIPRHITQDMLMGKYRNLSFCH